MVVAAAAATTQQLLDCALKLSVAGFTVVSLSCDGASENRRVAKSLCDVSAKELIDPDLLRAAAEGVVREARKALPQTEETTKETLEEIAKLAAAFGDILIGWRHRCGLEERVIIWVPDMPHVLKKVANSLELRDAMELDGQPVRMRLLYDVFKATHFDSTGTPTLKSTKLTEKHFHKNPLTRMNVRLAAQVLSNTMFELCTTTLARVRPDMHKRLAPIMGPTLWLVRTMNRVTDIMNSSVQKEGVHLINSAAHPCVLELLSASAGVLRWKLQSTEDDDCSRPAGWLAKEAGNDTVLLGLAVAAVARLHASATCRLILRRLDQDPCEHHFANVRQLGGHGGVDVAVAKRAQMVGQAMRMSRGAKTNGAGAPKDEATPRLLFDIRDYMPLPEDRRRESLRVWY